MSYAEYFLYSKIKTAKICGLIKTGESYFFPAELKFKVSEAISMQFNVSERVFILFKQGQVMVSFHFVDTSLVSTCYKDNG